ncbi:MAG: DNA replication and repair protein RecF [Candidatus Saccharimonadales bacterium]
MNKVASLRLNNVRSHQAADFQFVGGMNAIVGPNGSGKTTILEALYTLLRGSSFKGTIPEITRYSENQFRMQLELKSEKSSSERSLSFQQNKEIAQKKWRIEGRSAARLPITSRLPIVLFEPDLARLISGSPQRRRQHIDHIASQLDIETAIAQNRFERTLKQRNQLLKKLRESSTRPTEELFIWNTQLARLSEIIVAARHQILEKLQKEVGIYYRNLGGTDKVLLTYTSRVSSEPQIYGSRLLQFLETSVQRDIVLGYTAFGPHRDDIEVRLADQPALERASRGEVRTLVIALKLLETELLSQHFANSNVQPTLLLDDVLSELDLVHQERVLAGFKDHQVFLTTTDAHALTPGVHTIALG